MSSRKKHHFNNFKIFSRIVWKAVQINDVEYIIWSIVNKFNELYSCSENKQLSLEFETFFISIIKDEKARKTVLKFDEIWKFWIIWIDCITFWKSSEKIYNS